MIGSGWSYVLVIIEAKLVAAFVKCLNPLGFSSLATAITNDNSVSSKAMMLTDDGKNCGVSTDTTKP